MARKTPKSEIPATQRECVARFIKVMGTLSRGRSAREHFQSFLVLSFNALAKNDPFASAETRDKREAAYMQEVRRSNADDVRIMPEMVALTAIGVRSGDFLGPVAGEIGILNEDMGQFFTPWELCRLMARMTLGNTGDTIAQQCYMTVAEPACGSGAMVLAFAEAFAEQGHDVRSQLLVHATDLSETAFMMAYIQLTLAGISAAVVRGNSLTNEMFDGAFTSATRVFYARHGHLFSKPEPALTIRHRERPAATLTKAA